MNAVKKSPAEELLERSSERRALEALRHECRDQEELNSLLWAMVKSLQEARKGIN